MTTGLDYLLVGQFIESFFQPFIDIGISSDFIYLIVVSLAMVLIYIKTKDVGLVGIVTLMTSSVIIPFVTPTVQLYFFALILFGALSLVYSFYKSR